MMRMFYKYAFVFALVFQNSFYSFSQNVPVIIHPTLGDTIDRTEKINYFLFDNISAENYLFSVMKVIANDSLIIHFTKNDTIQVKIGKKEIVEINYRINKLNDCYNSDGSNYSSILQDPKADVLNKGNYSNKPFELKEKEKSDLKRDASYMPKSSKQTEQEKRIERQGQNYSPVFR